MSSDFECCMGNLLTRWQPGGSLKFRWKIFRFSLNNMTFKKIIVPGAVIYTYRLAPQLQKNPNRTYCLSLAMFARVKRDCHPVDCNRLHQLQAMTFNIELLKILFLRKCGYFQDFSINIIMFQIHKFAFHSVLHLENQHLHEGTVHIRLFRITRKK